METEGKAKVIASVWGATFFQFLAALAVLTPVYLEETVEFSWSIRKKQMNSTVSFKSTKTKQLTQQGIELILSPKPTRRPLPCLLSPSFFYGGWSLLPATVQTAGAA